VRCRRNADYAALDIGRRGEDLDEVIVRSTTLTGAVAFWGLAWVALWLGAELACPDGTCRVLDFDREVLGILNAQQRPWLDTVMAVTSMFGSILLLLPVALALAWRCYRSGRGAAALLLPVAVVGAWLLAHAGKLLVLRPRPDLYSALVAMPADSSFPSAHAMQITAFALAWLLLAESRPAPAGVVVAVLLVVMVALSRLYLQVHFPSDVVAGIIASAAWVIGLRLWLGRGS
jgi:undecaprenyl-diphosphatase